MKSLVGMAIVGLAWAGTAWAQDEKKDDKKSDVAPLLGLPSSADFKSKCKFTDDQCIAVDKIYTDYKDKAADAQNQVKSADDKKTAKKNLNTLKKEILGKLRDLCTSDDQKTSFDDATKGKKGNKT
ncbi:MAG TPA: hypothetical protein VEN81_06600 [Planctomycetota bacterium]|nr:hypothetical protein [Planctomycetota bacterium]